ncbi:hypothetical protein GCM10022205_19820 [Spinactinospora alkalitolerans]
MHDLQRDAPVQPQIVRDVDRGHATAVDTGLDVVAMVERRANKRVRSRHVHEGEFTGDCGEK